MDKLELRLSLYKGERGYWPDPPSNVAAKSDMWRDMEPTDDTQKALRTTEEWPGLQPLCAPHQETDFGPCRTLFPWDLFSGIKVYGAKLWYVWARRVIIRVILLWFCRGWHSDKGGATVGLVTPHGRAGLQNVVWGYTIWSIEARVSERRGKCALAKWTYSTWRAYRSVFTCLLSQVVQTARVTVASVQAVSAERDDLTGPAPGTVDRPGNLLRTHLDSIYRELCETDAAQKYTEHLIQVRGFLWS